MPLGFFYFFTYTFCHTGVIPLSPIFNYVLMRKELLAVHNDSKSSCLRDAFSDIVLVIVYHYPLYSSIPTLTALYKKNCYLKFKNQRDFPQFGP